MARKPLLDATSRPATAYSEWTKNYRQSANVKDRRGKMWDKPTETPVDALYDSRQKMGDPRLSRGGPGGMTGRVKEDTSTLDDYASDMAGFGMKSGDTTPTSSTRKVSAEEAIRRTHTERD